MNNYWLKVPFNDLSEKVKEQIAKGKQLEPVSIASEEELETARIKKREWVKETVDVLNACFVEPNNAMITEFRNSASNATGFHISGTKTTLKQEIDKVKNSLSFYINGLNSFLDDARLSDIMVDPEIVNIDERKRWTIEDKQVFILKKLSKGKKGAFYHIQPLMESNGLEVEYDHEVIELLEDMQNMGMVEQHGGLGVIAAKITVQGLKFIEKMDSKSSAGNDNDKPSKQEYETMAAKIDEVIEHLKKAGVEREILFEEMQELKELYLKLNKKNWKQIVLGKVADLALSKLIEKETFTFVYEQLTGGHYKLH